MIRALFTWSLKISAALYVRHFHILHTIEEAEVLNQNEFDNFDNMISIALICFLLGNRARVGKIWRRRCRWGKIWRTCAAVRSSLLLSLLSPPPLLPLCLTLRHRPCHGLFRRWSIAQQWQSRIGAVTHGWSPERLSLACGSGSMTPIGSTKKVMAAD